MAHGTGAQHLDQRAATQPNVVIIFTDLQMIQSSLDPLESDNFPVWIMIERIVTSPLFQSR
ncbi:MAG: hypothetical protein ACPGJR_00530 [Akkermansiaceae bacterium]